MKFTHRITWNIGLNRGAVPYPAGEAIEAVRDQLARRGIDGFTVVQGVGGYWQGEPAAVGYGVALDLAQILGQDAVAWAVDTMAAGGLAFAS